MNLEITIPVLNEEETIREKIKEMIEYTQKNILNKNVSFIIADNETTASSIPVISRKILFGII